MFYANCQVVSSLLLNDLSLKPLVSKVAPAGDIRVDLFKPKPQGRRHILLVTNSIKGKEIIISTQAEGWSLSDIMHTASLLINAIEQLYLPDDQTHDAEKMFEDLFPENVTLTPREIYDTIHAFPSKFE